MKMPELQRRLTHLLACATLLCTIGCVGMFTSKNQKIDIYSDTPLSITISRPGVDYAINDSIVAGYRTVSVERSGDFELSTSNDSLVAKTKLSPTFDFKWLGYNYFSYGIGNLIDISTRAMHSHRDIRIIELPRDNNLLVGSGTQLFQSDLASVKSLEEGNEFVEENRKQVHPAIKFVAAFGMNVFSVLLSFGASGYSELNPRTLRQSDELMWISLLSPFWTSFFSVGLVSILGGLRYERGSYWASLSSYYGGYFLGVSIFLLALLGGEVFDYSLSRRSRLPYLNILAGLPLLLSSLFAVTGYNRSRPLFVLAQKKSLGLSLARPTDFIRSLSLEMPLLGVRLLSNPLLQIVPSISLDFLRLSF